MASSRSKPVRPSKRFDSLEQEVFLNLWRTYDRLRAFEDDLFERFDLTPQQYNAMRLLKSRHPDKIHTLDLSAQLVSKAPDITRMLDKLEQRGFIERDRPPDNRRVVRVGITAVGLALLDDLREPILTCHSRQLGHLTRQQLNELAVLLHEAREPHEADDSAWK